MATGYWETGSWQLATGSLLLAGSQKPTASRQQLFHTITVKSENFKVLQ